MKWSIEICKVTSLENSLVFFVRITTFWEMLICHHSLNVSNFKVCSYLLLEQYPYKHLITYMHFFLLLWYYHLLSWHHLHNLILDGCLHIQARVTFLHIPNSIFGMHILQKNLIIVVIRHLSALNCSLWENLKTNIFVFSLYYKFHINTYLIPGSARSACQKIERTVIRSVSGCICLA